jgi:hypothetical protein
MAGLGQLLAGASSLPDNRDCEHDWVYRLWGDILHPAEVCIETID